MEKLIKLINEHQKEKHQDGIYLPVVAYRDWIFFSDWDCLSWVVDEIHLISKHYWFIKWLVENDKINKDLISRVLIRAYVSPKNHVSLECEFHDYYESLLMLVSISDTTIDDLISYLK